MCSLKIQPPAGEERQLNTGPTPERIAPLKIQPLAGEEASGTAWSYGWQPACGAPLSATRAPLVQQHQQLPTDQPKVLAASILHNSTPDYHALLQSFPAVVNSSKDLPPATHSVQHLITTQGRPMAAKYRRLDPKRLEAAKREFAELERQCIIRPSSSDWASPLHLVQMPDGSWRPCGDFRRLNL